MDTTTISRDHVKQTVINLYRLFLFNADSARTSDVFFNVQHSALMSLRAIKDLLGDSAPVDLIVFINGYCQLIEAFKYLGNYTYFDFTKSFAFIFFYGSLSVALLIFFNPAVYFAGFYFFILSVLRFPSFFDGFLFILKPAVDAAAGFFLRAVGRV